MPALMRAALGVFLGVVVVIPSAPVAADKLDDAKAAIDRSDYLAARADLAEALAAGTHGPAKLAEIYCLSGIVEGSLDRSDTAKEAFRRCLGLDPHATLDPNKHPPKVIAPFTAANTPSPVQPLAVETTTASDPPSVTVTITGDPFAMIQRIRAAVVIDDAPAQIIEQRVSEPTLTLPAGNKLTVTIEVLDRHGNRVVEREPIVIDGPAPEPEVVAPAPVVAPVVRAEPRPLVLRWWLWGGAAIAFAGAGTYFGIDAVRAKNELDRINANPSSHTFDDFVAAESRARRSVLLTNIGLIAGGTFAVAATVLYFTAPRHRSTDRRTSIRPVPITGGAAIILGGQL